MDYKKKDLLTYSSANDFLCSVAPKEVNEKVISRYLNAPNRIKKNAKLNEFFKRFISSAQNANMKRRVIGGAIGGIDHLSPVLLGFNPKAVNKKYGMDNRKLLKDIQTKLKPTGKIRKSSRSLWPQYCHTALSVAKFLSQFDDGKRFTNWLNVFYRDELTLLALPLILAEEIHGIGFALACDFLKELGYIKYGKPDVQVNRIFKSLGLVELPASDYSVLKAINRLAKNAGVTSYDVDKLFWLIGSGDFYLDRASIGKNGKIGRNGDKFIKHMKAKYKTLRAD